MVTLVERVKVKVIVTLVERVKVRGDCCSCLASYGEM